MGKTTTADIFYIDARNLLCPLPVLKLRKALSQIDMNAVVEIDTTDPVAAIDIPHFCNEAGHELLSQTEHETSLRFQIKRLT